MLELEALESFKRKKTKDKMGRGNGRVVVSLEGNGALKNKTLPFCFFFLTKKNQTTQILLELCFIPK